MQNSFGAATKLQTKAGDFTIYKTSVLGDTSKLPFSIKVMLESLVRNHDNFVVNNDDVQNLFKYNAKSPGTREVPFKVARVILQDFTGVPCVVDLAAMRHAMKEAGGDPMKINPLVPVDLVIDHSVQVDEYASPLALLTNTRIEFARNRERYEFLKWGQRAFQNFSVVPPGRGIVHQVNLEHLAKVVFTKDGGESGTLPVAYPDSLVGTDSHTTMINGLGVVGWGVGGIEAEACMLGQPISIVTPQVVGFELVGKLNEGVTATDLVLTVTQILRSHGVVEKFVEFFGDGLASMSVADRATIANMAPEYGATIGFFPVDDQTIHYLRLTGRDENHIDLVERYCKETGLWREKNSRPEFTEVLKLDLASVVPSIAGPRRPQDRVELRSVKQSFDSTLVDVFKKTVGQAVTPRLDRWSSEAPVHTKDPQTSATTVRDEDARTAKTTQHIEDKKDSATVIVNDRWAKLTHGDVVIAAITSCTNTSNPSVMMAAGLLAKKAVEKGLKVKPYVKTSLSPGSRVVTEYFDKAGLTPYLDKLGFNTTGYGCMTCIGNSGPLPEVIQNVVEKNDLVVASVLSGNRNFEGRINPYIKANYLASPPLVVAYAIAGSVDVNIMDEPLAKNSNGEPVYLRDIWPTQEEVNQAIASCISPDMFKKQYQDVGSKSDLWNEIPVEGGQIFKWDPKSTYIQNPPFFDNLKSADLTVKPIKNARVLVSVGDSVTTDHISPAGNIKKDSPAGKYLMDNGVKVIDFNQYGTRRGADQVMTRGTFANIRLKNLLAPGTEGGVTRLLVDGSAVGGQQSAGSIIPIFDAAQIYKQQNIPLIVLAGKDYGMGSSRDWAAKGTFLLGVKAVIAESFERIHRSNLVGMGVLPLIYKPGQTRESLGLTGDELFDIDITDKLKPGQDVTVKASGKTFLTTCRIDTPVELDYYRNGGILQTVLRKLMKE